MQGHTFSFRLNESTGDISNVTKGYRRYDQGTTITFSVPSLEEDTILVGGQIGGDVESAWPEDWRLMKEYLSDIGAPKLGIPTTFNLAVISNGFFSARIKLPQPVQRARPRGPASFRRRAVSGIDTLSKNPLYLIALQTDYRSLKALCSTNKRYAQICRDDNFWFQRALYYFKPANVSAEEFRESKSTVVDWEEYYLQLSKSGDLFGFGDSQYGVGNNSSVVATPTLLQWLKDEGITVKLAACGHRVSFVVTSDDVVYVFNNIGVSAAPVDSYDFFQERGLVIKHVSCNNEHAAFLTSDKNLYFLGSRYANVYGTYGLGHSRMVVGIVIQNTFFDGNVKHVSCGNAFTAVVTDDGSLWMFGSNTDKKLFIDKRDYILSPVRKVNSDSPQDDILTVECSSTNVIYLTARGEVKQFGRLYEGRPNATPYPISLPEGVKVKSLACSGRTFYAVSTEGDLYTAGSNEKGQLGNHEIAQNYEITPNFGIVPYFQQNGIKVQSVSAGREFACVVDVDGNLYSFGSNINGRLGITFQGPAASIVPTPTLVKVPGNQRVLQVACGYYHTLVITRQDD